MQKWLMFWLLAGTVASILLGTVATLVPLRIGLPASAAGISSPTLSSKWGRHSCLPEKKQHSWQTGMSAPLDTLLNNFPLW